MRNLSRLGGIGKTIAKASNEFQTSRSGQEVMNLPQSWASKAVRQQAEADLVDLHERLVCDEAIAPVDTAPAWKVSIKPIASFRRLSALEYLQTLPFLAALVLIRYKSHC